MTTETKPTAPGPHPESTCKKPHDWEKAVSCAYLRFIDWKRSQESVAKSVGVSVRSLGRWEASDWWPTAQAEAMHRWCGGVVAGASKTIIEAVEAGDTITARWALERLMPIMRPPTQRNEHTGKDGGPVEAVGRGHILLPDNGRGDREPDK